jgi:hypothetical protein
MDTVFSFFVGSDDVSDVVDEGISQTQQVENNQINETNFIKQGEEKNILTLIPNCETKKKGLIWNEDYTEGDKRDAYSALYDHLVEKQYIKTEVSGSSVFSGESVATIDKGKIDKDKLMFRKDDPNFPEILKCFNIDSEKLKTFFREYKYNITDGASLFTGGKRKKTVRKKNKRKNKRKSSKKK